MVVNSALPRQNFDEEYLLGDMYSKDDASASQSGIKTRSGRPWKQSKEEWSTSIQKCPSCW